MKALFPKYVFIMFIFLGDFTNMSQHFKLVPPQSFLMEHYCHEYKSQVCNNFSDVQCL